MNWKGAGAGAARGGTEKQVEEEEDWDFKGRNGTRLEDAAISIDIKLIIFPC